MLVREGGAQFVERLPSLPPQLRRQSLQGLCQQLEHRKEELYMPAVQSGGESQGQGQGEADAAGQRRCLPEVLVAVWRLLRMRETQADPELQEMAAQFLAAVGVWEPNALALRLPGPGEATEKDGADGIISRRARTHLASSDLAPAESRMSLACSTSVQDELVGAILLLLSACLESNAATIELVARTLKGLLATSSGDHVLRELALKDQLDLKVFSKGVSEKLVHDVLAIMQEDARPASLEDPRTWQTTTTTTSSSSSRQAHEDWICRIVFSLLQHVSDPVLRLCQQVALHNASLAELLFPHVLGELAARCADTHDLCATISEQVIACISAEKTSLRATQLILNAMNDLRRCHMVQARGLVRSAHPGSADKDEATPSRAGKRGALGNGHPAAPAPVEYVRRAKHDTRGESAISEWLTVYWLQVDYLTTARAAQRCGAYFTSILYIELWCEAHHGRLTLGEPDFSDNSEIPVQEQLLLNAYSHISEPDGIYGVARTNKANSQLALFRHEGSWGRVLEGCDQLLRRRRNGRSSHSAAAGPLAEEEPQPCGDFSQALGASSRDASSLLEGRPGLEMEAARALQQMGCLHVQDAYWRGLPAADLRGDIAELQCEAAWRVGRWDTDDAPPVHQQGGAALRDALAGGPSFAGFNAAINSSLKALVDGDSDSFVRGIKFARQSLASSVAHVSMESTHSVYPAIVKLQAADSLVRAWELRWPAMPHLLHVSHSPGASTATSAALPPGARDCRVPTTRQLGKLEREWSAAISQLAEHYELVEPLLLLRGVLLRAVGRDDLVPVHLCEAATLARRAKRLSQASSAVHELTHICSRLLRTGDGAGSSGEEEEEEALPKTAPATSVLHLVLFRSKVHVTRLSRGAQGSSSGLLLR
eukprot:jgi/Mesen1/7191/ME000371S06276